MGEHHRLPGGHAALAHVELLAHSIAAREPTPPLGARPRAASSLFGPKASGLDGVEPVGPAEGAEVVEPDAVLPHHPVAGLAVSWRM